MKRILVVDDDPHIVDLVKNRLEVNNYKVIVASDGKEGLEEYKAEQPDLIILDILMPQMDGYTFIRELKTITNWKLPPIIVLTAKEKMQDIFKIEGVSNYMVKPFKAEELLERIKKLVRDA